VDAGFVGDFLVDAWAVLFFAVIVTGFHCTHRLDRSDFSTEELSGAA
jgi:hypothetical protein